MQKLVLYGINKVIVQKKNSKIVQSNTFDFKLNFKF